MTGSPTASSAVFSDSASGIGSKLWRRASFSPPWHAAGSQDCLALDSHNPPLSQTPPPPPQALLCSSTSPPTPPLHTHAHTHTPHRQSQLAALNQKYRREYEEPVAGHLLQQALQPGQHELRRHRRPDRRHGRRTAQDERGLDLCNA